MKKLIFGVLILMMLSACNHSEETSSTGALSLRAKPSSISSTAMDTVLFSEQQIESYNITTHELSLSGVPTSEIEYTKFLRNYPKITCYLNQDSLFTFSLVSDIMSSIVNNLVLYRKVDGRLYFEDGYPLFNSPSSSIITLRESNQQIRNKSWLLFIDDLRNKGKIKE